MFQSSPTHKIRMGKSQKVENKKEKKNTYTNYTLSEFHIFLQDFIQQEGNRGSNLEFQVFLFVCFCGMGSELLWLPKCIKWSVSLKTRRSVTFWKIHQGYLLISTKIEHYLEPLWLSLIRGELRNTPHEASLPAREKLIGSQKLLPRKKENRRQRCLEQLIFITWSPFSSLRCLPTVTMLILPKQWPLLWLTVSGKHWYNCFLLLCKTGVVPRVYHFHDHMDPKYLLLVSNAEEVPSDPWSRELFSTGYAP